MAALQLEEVPIELFTVHSRIREKHRTRHIRHVLNEAKESCLDLQAVSIDYAGKWEDRLLFSVPPFQIRRTCF